MKPTVAMLLLLAFLGSSPAAATTPLTVTLTVTPAEVLPGTAPSFVIRVTNAGAASREFSGNASLEVTSGDHSFTARALGERELLLIGSDPARNHVAAGSSAEYYVPAVSAGGYVANSWFADERLNVPGRYQLRVRLFFGRESAPPEEVLSNPAVLDVVTPRGVDARVWEEMRKLKHDRIWTAADWFDYSNELGEFVWATFRESSYVPYLVSSVATNDTDRRIANMESVVARDPDSTTSNALRLGIADLYAGIAAERAVKGDLEGAVRARARAAETLSQAVRHGSDAFMSAAAQKQLAKLPDLDYYRLLSGSAGHH